MPALPPPRVIRPATYNLFVSNSVANTNINDPVDTTIVDSGAIPLPPDAPADVNAAASCTPAAAAEVQGRPQSATTGLLQIGGSCRLKCQVRAGWAGASAGVGAPPVGQALRRPRRPTGRRRPRCRLRSQHVGDYKKVTLRSSTWGANVPGGEVRLQSIQGWARTRRSG